MKNLTIFGLLLLAFILMLSSCFTSKEPRQHITKTQKAEVCFLNHSAKVAEVQFSGEKQIHKVHPQQELCLKRFAGTYTYNLKIGRKTSKNLSVYFEEGSTSEVSLTFGR